MSSPDLKAATDVAPDAIPGAAANVVAAGVAANAAARVAPHVAAGSPPDGLDREAAAFDRQITERVRNGHVPDLRRAPPCDYFHNNAWRHPDFIRVDFREMFEAIEAAVREYAPQRDGPRRILEIGCGPGHMSLELSRAGHDVVGIDLSPACIDVAEGVAADDPARDDRGALRYTCGDIFDETLELGGLFDAVVFVSSLHHFADQDRILARVGALLTKGGVVVADEPTRDRCTEGNATFAQLVRMLLSVGGGFHETVPIPTDASAIQASVANLTAELTCTDDAGDNTQSPNDNDAGYAEMAPALRRRFDTIVCRDRYAFFHEMIGGLRFDDATNAALALALREFDAELCRLRVLQPTEFFYVGRRRKDQP